MDAENLLKKNTSRGAPFYPFQVYHDEEYHHFVDYKQKIKLFFYTSLISEI
jgi:hypothetical protein